jgi:hypothetical protein
MNLRAKLVFSIAVMGLVCLMLPGAVRADTAYTYTSNQAHLQEQYDLTVRQIS